MDYPIHNITGAVLAGGQGSRMEYRDKGLIEFRHQPLIEHIINRMSPQVSEVIINANRNAENYQKYGLRVVADNHSGSPGPLAGIAAALTATQTPLLGIVPCDSPFLPLDLMARLYASLTNENADLAVAYSGRLQPVFCLSKRTLLENLSEFLEQGGRKINHWHKRVNTVYTDFNDTPASFININSAEDLEKANISSEII